MADYTATAHVFPSANDLYGSQPSGWGKSMYESNLGPYLAWAMQNVNYIVSGGLLPSSSASLSITVPSAVAYIYGHYVAVDATAVTVGASVTTYVFLKIMLDSNSNVSAVKYETNTTGTAPSYSVLIGTCVSGGSTITSTVDRRRIGPVNIASGPYAVGSGSSTVQETFTSSTGNLSGVHFYSGDVTLNSAHTLTIPAGSGRLIIVANGTITINGTITGAGGGLMAGASGSGAAGNPGTDQPGGGGGSTGGAGGSVLRQGLTVQAGAMAAGTQVVGGGFSLDPGLMYGGASGGASLDGGSGGRAGGRGGASIVLIAPMVVLAATATLNTSGGAGTAGNGTEQGGGGGGAGNICIITRSYTDNGCTFTQTGGAGGTSGGAGAGYAGAAGVKQILIY